MRDRTLKYLLVLPAVVAVFATAVWPLLDSAILSFRVWKLSRSRVPGGFVGFDNYVQAFTSPDFIDAAANTLLFVFFSVAMTTLLALGLALLPAKGGPFRRAVQTLLILPFAMRPALVGVSWRFMFPPEFGLFAAVSAIVASTICCPRIATSRWCSRTTASTRT